MKINLQISFSAVAVASGLAVAAFNARAVDAAGNVLTLSVLASDIAKVTEAGGGGSFTSQLVGDAAPGSFSGIVYAADADGNQIGGSVSFSGTVPDAPAPPPPPAPGPNLQPLPASVTVTVTV